MAALPLGNLSSARSAAGLVTYMPLTEAKLVPTLQAAQRAGIDEVLCVDEYLHGQDLTAIVQRALGNKTGMRVSQSTPNNLSSLTQLLGQLAENRWGVFAAHENGVEGAAALARFLKQSGLLVNPASAHSQEAARTLRFKDQFRGHIGKLFKKSLPDILPSVWNGTFAVDTLSVAGLRHAGAPDLVVIKPRNASASRGVERIDLSSADADKHLKSIAETLNYLRQNKSARAIDVNSVQVESFVPGEEYSVDGFRKGGETYVGAVHWKPDMEKDWRKHKQFVEGRFVSLPPQFPEYDLLEKVNDSILSSIPGLGDTVFHAEYRIDPESGKVFPIEIGGRPGGGSLAQSAEIVSGVNLYEAGVRLAMGLPVATPMGPYNLTAESVIYAQQDGILKRFTLELPGEDPIEVVKENENLITETLNRWLARISRAGAAKIYENFVQEVPFNSPVRQKLKDSFVTEGVGLDAVVREMHVWSHPGDSIFGFAGVYLGGLLLTSKSGSTTMTTLADLNAAMGLLPPMFHSDVAPF